MQQILLKCILLYRLLKEYQGSIRAITKKIYANSIQRIVLHYIQLKHKANQKYMMIPVETKQPPLVDTNTKKDNLDPTNKQTSVKKRTFNFSKLKNKPIITDNASYDNTKDNANSINPNINSNITTELLLTQLADNDVIENYLQTKHRKEESGNHAIVEFPTAVTYANNDEFIATAKPIAAKPFDNMIEVEDID